MGENEDKVKQLTRDFPVVIETDVRWGDMDAFNHVNNVSYLRYFESGRIAYFDALELADFFGLDGVGPILAETSCRYKFPLTYPDRVSVGVRSEQLGEDRFTQQYVLVSHRHGRVAATGDGTIVTFDYSANRKVSIPDRVRRRIEALEGREGGRD
ncbi:MAG: thioesterase family protein [Gammaproteobacteria bacterium]|nr:thioesterase family protein [Gammaproteobacteria bacterium]